jgi:transposase
VVADLEDTRVPAFARTVLQGLVDQLRDTERRVEDLDAQLAERAQEDKVCQRLTTIPGIGPITATALTATVGDATVFESGRHLAAWLGLVPRQHSSGGKKRLGGISKAGDGYLRRLLVHGARAVMRWQGKTSPWLAEAPAGQRRGGGVGQQAGAHRLGGDGARGGLPQARSGRRAGTGVKR